MIWVIIMIAIIAIIFYSKNKSNSGDAHKAYSIESAEISKDLSKEAIQFFDNYLSLCENHSVTAVCHLSYIGNDEFGINTKMECIITAIDGEHGDEAFGMIKRVWTQHRQEKMRSGDYSAVTYAGDGFIKQYFGCDDLHYVFTEADEYQFENGQVIMSFERPMYTREGAKWLPTLSFIKQELQKKWENATITVGEGGMLVKPQVIFCNKYLNI